MFRIFPECPLSAAIDQRAEVIARGGITNGRVGCARCVNGYGEVTAAWIRQGRVAKNFTESTDCDGELRPDWQAG